MTDFQSLNIALRRSSLLATGICLASLGITAASLLFAFITSSNAHEAALRMPVLVVPGAVGGIYSPGLTEENIRATARYLANLATNFSGVKSFHERFDEIELFSSPQFLASFQRARASLARDVETQSQSRTFFASPGTEHMHQTEGGQFDYIVSGERVVYASGLPMQTRQSELRLRLRWGTPSPKNRAGIVLEGIDVRDLGPESGHDTGGAPRPLKSLP